MGQPEPDPVRKHGRSDLDANLQVWSSSDQGVSRVRVQGSSIGVAVGVRFGRALLHAPSPPFQVRVHTVYVERPSEWTDWTSFGNVTTGIHGHIVVLRQDGNFSQTH